MEAAVVSDKKPKLLDRVRSDLRVKHYSIRTERAYIDWIRRFILFHGKRHPNEMGEQEISAFLTHLAVDRHVAASTQNQALCALLFLYQQVLQLKLDFIDDVARVKRPAKIPVVFTREEARAVLDQLEGEYQLMSELLYGSGLRLMECVRLRVKDIDFGYGQIIVRVAKACVIASRFCPNSCAVRFSYISNESRSFTSAMFRRAAAAFASPLLCDANTRAPRVHGHGNMSSRRPRFRPTLAHTRSAVIISVRKISRTP
jgi:hypothetical protein